MNASALTRRLLGAAKKGDAGAIQRALDDGADVHALNGNKWTAIHEAAFFGHAEAVSVLLRAHADPNVAHVELSYTPLFRATFYADAGYADVVRVLVDGGAAPSLPMKYGWCALHNAAECGALDSIEILLRAGADPDVLGGPGRVHVIDCAKKETRARVAALVQKYASIPKQSVEDAKRAAALTAKRH